MLLGVSHVDTGVRLSFSANRYGLKSYSYPRRCWPPAALPQQRRRAPQHRGLAVEIAGSAGAGEGVVEIIFLAGGFADPGHVAVLVNLSDHRHPPFPPSRALLTADHPPV